MTCVYRYEEAVKLLATIRQDVEILAGEVMGPSDASWQDVAGALAVNLRVLAARLDAAREGRVVDGPFVFPSFGEKEE